MRQALRFLCAFVPLLILGSASDSLADDATSTHEVHVERDIRFATVDGVDLLLNLHLPQDIDRPPLVMFIHGGGWQNGDRTRCRLAWVAGHGYAVASIEYRLSHEAAFPAQIHDCKGALRWLRAHQEEYGYDAQRVVVAGTSAGGHLAALMGTSADIAELEGTTAGHLDRSSRVQGVIDYFGPTDFLMRSKLHPAKTENPDGSVYKLLGGPASQNQELAQLASPAMLVTPDDPPLLILHGDKDRTVQLVQSQRLQEIYQQHELPVTLHVETGAGHGWKTTEKEQEVVLDFLKQQLKSDVQ